MTLEPEDEGFVRAFEAGTLAPEAFHHSEHVRLAWLYLREHAPPLALARFTDGLRRYATLQGKPDRYHETITWAYLLLIHERMARGAEATWDQFAAANPDLLRWKPSILDGYYRPETLASPLARRVFLLPDREGRAQGV
jgi:hypothetical protein